MNAYTVTVTVNDSPEGATHVYVWRNGRIPTLDIGDGPAPLSGVAFPTETQYAPTSEREAAYKAALWFNVNAHVATTSPYGLARDMAAELTRDAENVDSWQCTRHDVNWTYTLARARVTDMQGVK